MVRNVDILPTKGTKKPMKMVLNFSGYFITKNGQIWSVKHKKFLKPYQGGTSKYWLVMLRKNGKSYNRLIHRLVLETFVGPCPEEMECCHNNGNMFDNRLENLRWDTRKANRQDAMRQGTFPVSTDHINCKHTARDIRMMIYIYATKLFTQKEIAKMYGICQQKISQIINRKRHDAIWTK